MFNDRMSVPGNRLQSSIRSLFRRTAFSTTHIIRQKHCLHEQCFFDFVHNYKKEHTYFFTFEFL